MSKGCIICTASNAGLYPFPVAPIYAASKCGVVGLVRSLARSLEREAIQINALAPAVLGMQISKRLRDQHLMFTDRDKYCTKQRFVQTHDINSDVNFNKRCARACI